LSSGTSLTPEQRKLRASLAAHERWGRHDPKAEMSQVRKGFDDRFLRQVDDECPGLPEAERQRRAKSLLQAHMKRLALASSRARSKKAS
jgi:hypothetical protein